MMQASGQPNRVTPPKYEEYALLDLYQVLNTIKGEQYPHVLIALEKEILERNSSSVAELQDCYFALDKDRHPEHARQIIERIDELGGTTARRPNIVTEENKHQTFWPRFWAQIIDGFVIALPLIIVLTILESVGILGPAAKLYGQQIAQIAVLVYSISMHTLWGQTVGKMATRVKVWDKTETGVITFKQSILRDIMPLVLTCASLAFFLGVGVTDESGELTEIASKVALGAGLIGFAWGILEIITMLFSKKRRALHDLIAGTVVTRVP